MHLARNAQVLVCLVSLGCLASSQSARDAKANDDKDVGDELEIIVEDEGDTEESGTEGKTTLQYGSYIPTTLHYMTATNIGRTTVQKQLIEKGPPSEVIVRSTLGVIGPGEDAESQSTVSTPVVAIRPRSHGKKGKAVYHNKETDPSGPREQRRQQNGNREPFRDSSHLYFESKKYKGQKPRGAANVNNDIVTTTPNSREDKEESIEIISYLADSDSAVDMKQMPVTGRTVQKGADMISAFFVAADDDSNDIGRNSRHRFSVSTTDKPRTSFKPIVVVEESATEKVDVEPPPLEQKVGSSFGEIKYNGASGYIRRGRLTATTPRSIEVEPTPAASPEPVLVTPRQGASLLTSSDQILAPIQAAISLSSHSKDSKKEQEEGDNNMIEKQVLQEQPVYKTYIDIQKSIPFEIKEETTNIVPENSRVNQDPPYQVEFNQQYQSQNTYNNAQTPQYGQNDFLRQVMLAYQRLSDNPRYVPVPSIPETQVNYRQPPPLTQNLYYIYRNRYGLQPQQIFYYMPYNNDNENRVNGYIGRYIMQHSHENTGTEHYEQQNGFPQNSNPYLREHINPYNAQPQVSTGRPYVEQENVAQSQVSTGRPYAEQENVAHPQIGYAVPQTLQRDEDDQKLLTLNQYDILHDENGARSTTYFKVHADNGVGFEAEQSEVPKSPTGNFKEEEYRSQELIGHPLGGTYVTVTQQIPTNSENEDDLNTLQTEVENAKVEQGFTLLPEQEETAKRVTQQNIQLEYTERPLEYNKAVEVERPVTKLVRVEKPGPFPPSYHNQPIPYPVAHQISIPVPHYIPYPQILPLPNVQYDRKEQEKNKRTPFRPSQPVYTSQYPPQTYRVVTVMRGRGVNARSIRGKKLCIEYGGFKPPLIPSVQIDEKFLENRDAEDKSAKEE